MVKPLSERTRCPTHPGDILKHHYMVPLRLSVSDLAGKLGVSRKTVSKIVNKRGAVTPDMAIRLSHAFNTSVELWLGLQQNHDLWHAYHDSQEWKGVKRIWPVIRRAA